MIPPALRTAAAHAFVASVDEPVLDDADRHHLERVLRLRPGQLVTVADGEGSWRVCRFEHGARLDPMGDVVSSAAPAPEVAVAFAPVKGDRTEWLVQKLTEVGVDRMIPVVTERAVVRWEGERAGRHVERLRRVAREAAMQSRRVWLPLVEDLTELAALAAREPVVAAEPGGRRLALGAGVVLVGPEGGFAPAELAQLPTRVDLGPHVLRAETAAMVAGVLLTAARHGLAGSLTLKESTDSP
jgi:16S rRNA (uracil1498-N3)-methyltransferase